MKLTTATATIAERGPLTQVVDRLVVLQQGSIIADGLPNVVLKDDNVLKTYFGAAPKERV